MKQHPKHLFCLNCSRPLSSTDNFCPGCGQQNRKQKLGVGTLLHDFFSNYFSFDSKITRSSIPFLLKPGVLTNKYNEGKRTSFIHPLRLYLIISFIFFFLLALFINKVIEEEKISLVSNNGSVGIQSNVPPEAAPKLNAALDSAQKKVDAKDSTLIQLPDSAAITNAGNSQNKYIEMFRDRSLTDEQLIDSTGMDKESKFDKLVVHQLRKIAEKDMDVFLPYLAKNLSILMFLLLPIFAFYLYVLFGRNEKYYISHAIHALHLHSFSFLMLSLLIILELAWGLAGNYQVIISTAFILITIYAFFSIKRVYGQGWIKTFFKFNLLGFFYFISLSVGALLEILISFILF